ncbi:DsbA family protein [Nocardia asteroides]|uniref:DsbA family protein n=1 Tax=Nocardia asteroides TaxID=1824 RepID=UPI0037C65176
MHQGAETPPEQERHINPESGVTRVADIDLYLDPVCPFAWVTAIWLREAAPTHTVTLRQMSLAVLNDGHDIDDGHRPMIERSRRAGRLFAAIDSHGESTFAQLYQQFGQRLHAGGNPLDHAAATALDAAGLDPALVTALDNPRHDPAVTRAHERSQSALGGRGGSPIIVIDGHAFNGPVLTAPPDPSTGRALLGALLTLANIPGFAALQRPYQGPPQHARTEYEN